MSRVSKSRGPDIGVTIMQFFISCKGSCARGQNAGKFQTKCTLPKSDLSEIGVNCVVLVKKSTKIPFWPRS